MDFFGCEFFITKQLYGQQMTTLVNKISTVAWVQTTGYSGYDQGQGIGYFIWFRDGLQSQESTFRVRIGWLGLECDSRLRSSQARVSFRGQSLSCRLGNPIRRISSAAQFTVVNHMVISFCSLKINQWHSFDLAAFFPDDAAWRF